MQDFFSVHLGSICPWWVLNTEKGEAVMKFLKLAAIVENEDHCYPKTLKSTETDFSPNSTYLQNTKR